MKKEIQEIVAEFEGFLEHVRPHSIVNNREAMPTPMNVRTNMAKGVEVLECLSRTSLLTGAPLALTSSICLLSS